MNIWQTLRNRIKKAVMPVLTAGLTLAVAVGSTIPFTALKANAASPAFNGHANDEPTIQVSKNGANDWNKEVTLKEGDTAQFFMYAHNYIADTTAKNVHMKAVVPTDVSTSHTVQGLLTADNAVDESPQKAVTVKTANNTELRINKDSVRHYVNQNGQYVEKPLANGSDLFSANGLNLGDINGCWQYLQAVTFTATVYQRGNGAISTYKEVAVASVNDQWSRDKVSTTPGNVIDYHIYVENTGEQGALFDPVWVTDTLDSKLTYKPESSWLVTRDAKGNDVRYDFKDSQINFNGQTISWRVDNVPALPQAAFHLYFQATLAGNSTFNVGTTTIPNKALIRGMQPQGEVDKDTNTVYVDVVKSPAEVVKFDIEKDVRNLTTQSQINNDTPVAASPGDLVQYTLHIVNTGNVTTDALIRDIMPTGVTIDGSVLRKSISEPESAYKAIDQSGLFSKDGYLKLANVAPGNSNGVDIRFKAKVNTNLGNGNTTLTNIGRVYSNQHGLEDADNAYVIVTTNTGYLINKYVLDPGTGQWVKDSNAVLREGDKLRYRIDIVNTGNTSLLVNNVRDVLPQYVRYVDNSLVIDPHISAVPVSNDEQFFAGGIGGFQLLPGITKRFEFDAEIVPCPVLGLHTLVNTAYIKANNEANESLTNATIKLRVIAPDGSKL